MRDRGQSELLGFLLIFAVVVLTIALAGTAGYAGVENAKEFQRTTNAEGAFVAFAEEVDGLARRGAPSRKTELSIADATLSSGDVEELTVVVGAETAENTTVVETRPLVYESGDTAVVYSAGSVVREDGPNAVLVREPEFVLTEEAVILPIVATGAAEGGPVGGTTAATVETRRRNATVAAIRERPVNVTLRVRSPRADAWEAYLEGTAADCTRPADDAVECSLETDRAYVTVTEVDVRVR